jgi:hypothetical protein
MEKLKRAVIKEELVTLTGDFKKAIVLNQMIYWSERRKDADKFLKEEIERIEKYATLAGEPEDFNIDKLNSHGWIYKKSEELSEETMIGVKPKAMRSYLKELIDNGWLDERRNPHIKMDRTMQYRVNLLKIQQDLNALGYALEGYSLPKVEKDNTNFPQENTDNGAKVEKENTKVEKENRSGENENTKVENERAIPKTTTETTKTNITTEITSSLSSEEVDLLETFLTDYGFNEREIKETLNLMIKENVNSFKASDVMKQLKVLKTSGEKVRHRPSYFVNGLAMNVGRVEPQKQEPVAHGNIEIFDVFSQ